MSKADDVAAAILTRAGEVTTWKLQKLVYYTQSWALVNLGHPIFDEGIEAWREGPVVRYLYDQHRMRNRVNSWPRGSGENLEADELSVIDWVFAKYGGLSAETLSEMTHAEVPWFVARAGVARNARSSNELNLKIMQSFYARQAASPDIAVSQAVSNAALEGVELGTEWEYSLRALAEGELSADELVSQELYRIRYGD